MAKRVEAVSVRVRPETNGRSSRADEMVRLFNDIRDELISTLLYVLGNRDDALDAAQEAFIKCWNARDQVHQVLNLRAWIFRVCFNTAKDMQRSAWHRRAKPLKAEQYTMEAKGLAPGEAVERRESVDRLRKFVRHMAGWYAQKHPDEDFAETFAVWLTPRSNWRKRYRGWAALEKLRKILV